MAKDDTEGAILLEEIQQFTKASARDFVKILMGIVFLALLVSLLYQKGRLTDYNKLLIVLLPILLVVNIILASRLITQIRSDGIYVRFPPWQPGFVIFSWTDIAELYVREYGGMKEFMGWGIRYAPRMMGYIVAGTSCIEITLKNGGTVIITTQRREEVKAVLDSLQRF
jgi:hypothetical protein